MLVLDVLIAARLASGALATPADVPVTNAPDFVLAEPRWTKHRVGPGERPIDVAMRYGVNLSELARWNDLEPTTRRLRVGARLEVLARRLPPPRVRIRY